MEKMGKVFKILKKHFKTDAFLCVLYKLSQSRHTHKHLEITRQKQKRCKKSVLEVTDNLDGAANTLRKMSEVFTA
jgi:hypothetical protein